MKTLKLFFASIFLLIIPVFNIVAQEEIAQVPTPNAADFGRFGDIPVSPYSGRANVEIPIYSTTQRGVTLDVKLSYDTSGLPMNGLPGWTGHGWSLNVGGVITRAKKGLCDEFVVPRHFNMSPPNYNYFQMPIALCNIYQNTPVYESILYYNQNDLAPDIFYFNFMGKSGRFLLGNDGEWKVDCEENLDVLFDVTDTINNYIPPFYDNYIPGGQAYNTHPCKTIKGFTIVDERGTKYIFGGNESFIEYSIPFFLACPVSFEMPWTASAWYLKEVQDRLGNILYSFTYQKGYYLVQAYNSLCQNRYKTTGKWVFFKFGESYPSGNHQFPYTLSLTRPIYLSEVKAIDGTKIEFHLADVDLTAQDIYPTFYKGKTILERLKDGLGIHKIIPDSTFYFLQGNNPVVAAYQKPGYEYVPDANIDERDDNPLVTMGLKCLNYIKIRPYGGDHYYHKFEYSTENRLHLVGIKTYNPMCFHPFALRDEYKFKYNHYDSIPSDYLTTAVDHWGYYNGNAYRPDTLSNYEAFHHTRDVNLQLSQYGMLTEIQYPTGGVSVLEYEQNRYDRYWDNAAKGVVEGTGYAGGLRIKKITDFEDSTRSKLQAKREYTYFNGELQALPRHYWKDWETYANHTNHIKVKITSFYSQSIIPLTNSFGQHIGYSDVWETFADGTRKEYHYSNFSNFGDSLFVMSLMDTPQLTSPYDERCDRSYGRGKLLSLVTKDGMGKIWNIKRYRYRSDDVESNFVLASNAAVCHGSGDLDTPPYMYFTGGVYKIYYPKFDVVSVLDSTCYGDSFICDSTFYQKSDYPLNMTLDYPHKGFMRICKSETTNRGGMTKKVEYTYPTSSMNSSLCNSTACAEFFNPVISTETIYNGHSVKKEKTLYGMYPPTGHYMPQSKSEVFTGDVEQVKITYNNYTASGLLSQYTPQGEPPIRLYWNAKDRLMAQSQGNISFVFNKDAESPHAVLMMNNGQSAFHQPNTLTSTYVYDQQGNLKGMASGQGNTTYYGYDNFNRLSSVTDLNDDTLQTFHYTIRKNGIENNVLTRTMQDSLSSHVVPSYLFYDGLGRPVQTASKGVNTSGKYVYEGTIYDTNGREQQKWLPFEGTSSPDFLQDLSPNSYNTYNEQYAYNEYGYDPLGRPTSIMPPGERHHNADKPQRIEYLTNTTKLVRNTVSSELNSHGRYKVVHDGNYGIGTLVVERRADEDGKFVSIYKDLMGNVVREDRGDGIITNYIYDSRGRLAMVRPPLSNSISTKSYIYEYHYDDHDRLVKKFLPGCDPIQYWYDTAGRLIYMQDGRMAEAGKYRFYLYDPLGRLAVQGICTDPYRQSFTSPLLTYFSSSNEGICGTGYINAGPTPINPEIEIVNYYDNYGFLSAPIYEDAVETYDMRAESSCTATSLLTGRVVRTSGGGCIVSSLYYDAKGQLIDEREGNIYGLFVQRNHEYTFTGEPLTDTESITTTQGRTYSAITHYVYDPNSGKLTSKTLQYDNGTPVTIATYVYDKAGRVEETLRGDGMLTDTYAYTASGLPTVISSSADSLLLREELHYNDGAGTPCYNGNVSAMTWHTGNDNVMRNYLFSYDSQNRLTAATYSATGATEGEADATYSVEYDYDKNSSLTRLVRKGKRYTGYGLIDSLVYSYDFLGGNKCKRIGDRFGSLAYENSFDFKAKNSISVGYKYDNCGALITDRYKGIDTIRYDFNGQPVSIKYANGNAIIHVYSALGERLSSSIYTAPESPSLTSEGWGQISMNPVVLQSAIHIGNFVLTMPTLQTGWMVTRYDFDGGYISANGGYVSNNAFGPYTSLYHYYCRDHLGNNRVVVSEDGEIEQVTHYYPYGGLFGDVNTEPGLQPYKFGGKEFQHTHGLDLYDFHARQYDPATGLFTTMDPLCEKYYHLSPYAYCMGNPVNTIDPDGRDTINISYNDGKWSYSDPIIAKGNDVFNVIKGKKMSSTTFSEGTYGQRVDMLNLEDGDSRDSYALGVYHVSGAKEAGTGFFLTPGGLASTQLNSGRRIPEGTYPIIPPNNGAKWRKPGVGGAVAHRGIRFHYSGSPDVRSWTQGCFVLSYSYSMNGDRVEYIPSESKRASRSFDELVGEPTTFYIRLKVEKKERVLNSQI